MPTTLDRYRELDDQLWRLRIAPDADEAEIDLLCDELDVLWYAMDQQDRERARKEAADRRAARDQR